MIGSSCFMDIPPHSPKFMHAICKFFNGNRSDTRNQGRHRREVWAKLHQQRLRTFLWKGRNNWKTSKRCQWESRSQWITVFHFCLLFPIFRIPSYLVCSSSLVITLILSLSSGIFRRRKRQRGRAKCFKDALGLLSYKWTT